MTPGGYDPTYNPHLNDGSHDTLDVDRDAFDRQWLVFMRHHPDLYLLSRKLRET